MLFTSFLVFVGVALLVIVTPGPDTALIIRNSLLGGRGGGVLTALGVAAGQTVWALATSIGLVALLVACEPLFRAVQYAGAAYLVIPGLSALRQAFRPGSTRPAEADAGPVRRLNPVAAFRQGLISNLGNPKMAVFFASLLPQFAIGFAGLILLGLVFAAMTFAWLAVYALVVTRLGGMLRRSWLGRAVEAVTGGLLIALGIRIAVEQR